MIQALTQVNIWLFTQIDTALNNDGSICNDSDKSVRPHKRITSLSAYMCYPVEDNIPVLPPMLLMPPCHNPTDTENSPKLDS